MKTQSGSQQTSNDQRSLDLQKQFDYVDQLKEAGFDFGLVLGNAFVRGMRDIGYKSTAYALNELNDNAIQAGAQNVHTAFGYAEDNKSQKKPDMLAVVDDGHGMPPKMIQASVLWGGTHREFERDGMGRFGYGLPSACVSIGKAYTVYSKLEGGEWFKVTIDLDEIDAYFTRPQNKPYTVPEPRPTAPPNWVLSYIKKNFKGYTSGTVVLIDKIDRLDHWTTQGLRKDLLQDFGITYRNFLRQVNMGVDGQAVEATDPLFITPGFRFYDLDDDRAEAYPPMNIDVKAKDGKEVIGTIKVRFSYMPPTFLRVPEYKHTTKAGKKAQNGRFSIRKDNNGFIFMREGRQIDVRSVGTPTTFQNNDRYIGVEVDFPAKMDEDFSITTSKQQVIPKPRIWEILEANDVLTAIATMRSRYEKESKLHETKEVDVDGTRPSEAAMVEAEKFFAPPGEETKEQRRRSEESLTNEAEKIAEQVDIPVEKAKELLLEKAKEQPYKVRTESNEGAPFYRLAQVGGQKVLYINTAHRFYLDLYAHRLSSPHVRYALETLLFVLGTCEVQSTDERHLFYQTERNEWSRRLTAALTKLEGLNTTAETEAAAEYSPVGEQSEEVDVNAEGEA